MTKNKPILFCFLALLAISSSVFSQEMVRPLETNPVVMNFQDSMALKNGEAPVLSLPFRDDFSYQGPFPDQQLWADKDVFINPTFAINPLSLGTATFDALDQYGKIYEEAQNNSFQIDADRLTSHPIRLDSVFTPAPMALSPADSVILTFYYQPQGNGSAPRERDSLVVEFLHTPGHFTVDPDNPEGEIWNDDLWVSIWRSTGKNFNVFLEENDSTFFQRVALTVDDEIYFRNDFRFRFRNYASFPLTKTPDNFAGNTSIWNVDYVTLDYGRSSADSFYYDIAFAKAPQSVLRNFQSMPWSHYIANPQPQVRGSFNVGIANLDDITYNYSYRYFVMDENNTIVRNYSGGTWNIGSFAQVGFQNYLPHANPPMVPNPFGALNPAPARHFRVHHVLQEGNNGDRNTRNDTIIYHQIFDNYFAYDDGIPENGYGLVGVNPRGAIRFTLSHTDTLEAVQFFFNATLNNRNQKPFRITVWKNLEPEEIIYQSRPTTVEYGAWLNEFITFPLEEPIEVSDTIYVGWEQMSDDFLNIGFDTSNDASAQIFYNSFGEWIPTIYKGALMIRPVFGSQMITNVSPEETMNSFSVFPNPVTGQWLTLQIPVDFQSNFETIVFDSSGKMVMRSQNHQQINVSQLPTGIYFLQLIPQNGNKIETTKFIISR